EWLERALATNDEGPTIVRARALLAAGYLSHYQGDPRGLSWLNEALTIFRTAGDTAWTAVAQFCLAISLEDNGDSAGARDNLLAVMSTFQTLGDRSGIAWSLLHLGTVEFGEGNLDAAEAAIQECLRRAGELGASELQAQAGLLLASVACARDDAA